NHIEPEQFWGYRYPLGRRYWKTTSPDQIGIQEGAFFAINHKLKHTHDELAQVAKHIETLANEANLTLRIQHLAEALSATNLSTDDLLDYFSDAQFLFGIVHFACHCEHPSGTSATESYLSLTAREATVELHLEELIALAGEGFRQHPFVFLNACESSTAGYSMQTSNFPTDLLNFGAGSVIATACVIPDRFASAFATEFYRRLLDKERHMQNLVTLSEVLWETRLHFLREYNNPLGLAYGLYADSAQAFLIEG
ncbi:MAG: CHAT domain-containing protein, partial [Anaerolineales bacterium]|nr:CHAT domain-containing protein [Anaerolineales bacterium]